MGQPLRYSASHSAFAKNHSILKLEIMSYIDLVYIALLQMH